MSQSEDLSARILDIESRFARKKALSYIFVLLAFAAIPFTLMQNSSYSETRKKLELEQERGQQNIFRLAETESMIAHLEAELADQDDRLAAVEAENKSLTAELSQSLASDELLAEAKSTIVDLETELAELEDQLAVLSAEVVRIASVGKEIERRYFEAKAVLSDARSNVATVAHELRKLQAGLVADIRLSNFDNTEARISSITLDLSSIDQELSNVEAILSFNVP